MLLHASRIFRRFPRPGYFLNFRKKLLTNSAARPGDVLLLCSDGISGVLTPAELREAMCLPPDAGCRLLETLVLEKGLPAQDNFTGTMISIQSINGRE